MYESEIRDILAADISVLEDGLVLLNKEQYIPNRIGTKSFIDLYARDKDGHHVLIELKRSDSAVRDAIHEINKYVEGVKRHLGVKERELRVIIASTTWKELLVPLSRYIKETTLAITSLKLDVGNDKRIYVSKQNMINVEQGRYIAPWHEVYWYHDELQLQEGIDSIEHACCEKGIDDFVIVILHTAKPTFSARESQIRNMLSDLRVAGMEASLNELPTYSYIAYFAMQILTKDQCFAILEKSPDKMQQAHEDIAGIEDEHDLLCSLHGSISALEPATKQQQFEIGYPAKFTDITEDRGFKIEKIIRKGIFSRNSILTDEDILAEISANDGTTGQRLTRSVSISNSAHFASLRKDINECLNQNPAWRRQIEVILEEVACDFPDATLDVNIFNPATGAFTVILPLLVSEQGVRYIPQYHITIRSPDRKRVYYGFLQGGASCLSYWEFLEKYYYSSTVALLLTMTWGGREPRDIDILEDLGLRYRSFRKDLTSDIQPTLTWQDDRWRTADSITFEEAFIKYLDSNAELIRVFLIKVGSKFDEQGQITHQNKGSFDEYINVEEGQRRQQFFHGTPKACDSCGCPFEHERYMIDCKIKDRTSWACMCGDCYNFEGEGIGWGLGQIYQKDKNMWLLVGGWR